MASFKALSVVGNTLIELLRANCPATLAHNPKFELYGPGSYDVPMDTGLSLMLYRVTVNANLRNRAPRRAADGRKMIPSLPLDLHFLLTAWALKPEVQYLLLGWAIRFLEDRNVLPASVLNLFDSEGLCFGADEAVEIVCDPLALADHLQLWDKLKTRLPVSLTYVLRSVVLDSAREMAEGAAVRTRGSAENTQ